MAVALNTYTFWHPDPRGGAARDSSSVVGPASLGADEATKLAVQATGYGAPTLTKSAHLSFPQFPPDMPYQEAVDAVWRSYNQCDRCHLSTRKSKIVHYVGDVNSPVVYIGEGPNSADDASGFPLSGSVGSLQDTLNSEVGIDTSKIFVMHIVGCRAAASFDHKVTRTTEESEIISCSERTVGYLRAVRPRVVVCLGKVATRAFWKTPPPAWSWHRFTPQESPEDWFMVGHAQSPAYLTRTIAMPSMYREYAAQRTFYSMLAARIPSLTKVRQWHFIPPGLDLKTPLVSWEKVV